jgi:hypothetical protein
MFEQQDSSCQEASLKGCILLALPQVLGSGGFGKSQLGFKLLAGSVLTF